MKQISKTDWIPPDEYLPKNKIELFDILGGMVCSKCGFDDDWRALEVDHIYGKAQGVEPIRNIGYWLENPDLAYEELQVLCANCHRIKTWEEKKTW